MGRHQGVREGQLTTKSGHSAYAQTRTFRQAIRAPDNGHSLSAILPVLRLQQAISRKINREQILGKGVPRTALAVIARATFPLWVPNWEGRKIRTRA